MITLPVQTLAAGASITVSAGSAGTVGAVVLYNESPNLVRVTWAGSSRWLPAWSGDVFYVNQAPGFTGSFVLTAQSISSASNAPSTVIVGIAYAPGEPIPGTYPVALMRQTNVGNSTLPTTAAQSVINDGNAAGATVVEATQSGQTTSSLNLENNGAALLAPVSNGVLLSALVVTPGDASTAATGSFGDSANPTNWALHGVADQVPPAGIQTGTLPAGVTVPAANISGSIPSATDATNLTGGTLTATGAASLDSGVITTDGAGNMGILGTTGLTLRNNTGRGIRMMVGFSGTGSGTFSHGGNTTPSCVQLTTFKLNSSQTMGYDTPGGTTVHVTAGAGFAWVGAALAFT